MIPFSFDAGAIRSRSFPAPLVLIGLLLLTAIGALYMPLWSHCWREWWREESAYSHGILIPPLAAFMVWQRRDRLAGIAVGPALSGLLLVVLGLGLQLFARWAHSTMLSWASFLILALGGIAFVGGWRLAGRLAGPVLFLTFMVPMWKMVTQPVVFGSQMASTAVAAALLRGTGFEVHQVGTILQLEQYTLQVAAACSGFKTMIALTAFAACYIYVLHGSLPKKLLLFAAAVAFSLLANGLRIGIVGITGELIDDTTAKWVHDNGGLPVTALALGGLFLLARLLKCELAAHVPGAGEGRAGGWAPGAGRRCRAPRDESDCGARFCHRPKGDAPATQASRPAIGAWHGSVATMLVVAAALIAWRMPTVHAESQARPVAARPLAMQLGQWQGTTQPVAPDVQKALPSAQVLSRRYRSALGEADVTIITGSDGTALHDPHDCVIGDGWEFVTSRLHRLPVEGSRGSMPVRDIVMTRGGTTARMWYWYTVEDQVYTSTLSARLALFRERLIHRRRQGAEFVRLIVGGNTTPEHTERMLADLARQIASR